MCVFHFKLTSFTYNTALLVWCRKTG